MPIQFTVQATALLYETDFESDPIIYVGCECNGGNGYKGRLSDIPPLAALNLVETKSNLLRLKNPPKQD